MATPYDANTAILHTTIADFATKIKQIATDAQNAETANLALNSEKLEGLTLSQIMDMVATTSGLTVAEVQAQLDDLIADLTGVPRAVANATQVLDSTANNLIMSPAGFWTALGSFWEQQVGAAPETLNEIHEIAAAIAANQDVITVIQDGMASKASKTELAAEATRLEGLITDAQTAATTAAATQVEVDNGVVADKYVAPNTLKVRMDAVRGEMEADVDTTVVAMNQAFVNAIAILNAP